MKTINFKAVGTKSLLFHKFNIEEISSLTKVRTGSAGNNPDEWKTTLFEVNNQLYMPAAYWFASITNGAVYTKVGRGTVKNKVAACMVVDTEMTMLNRYLPKGWQEMTAEEFPKNPTEPVYLDIRGVMNPNSKGRNVRYRVACSPGWETDVQVTFDDTIISMAQMKKVIEDAGKMIGIADARTLGHGRFAVEFLD